MPPETAAFVARHADRLERWLLNATVATLLWCAVLVMTGGVHIDLGGVVISSRTARNPLLLAGVLLAVRLALRLGPAAEGRPGGGRDEPRTAIAQLAQDWARIVEWAESILRVVARWSVALTLLLALFGATRAASQGAWAAGGADSFGYISQAELILTGSLVADVPLMAEADWHEAAWAFAPLGYRPADRPGAIVPTYPPGLPLVMAPFQAVGGREAVHLVVPLFTAAGIGLTFLVGRRLAGPLGGVAAALLLVASPTYRFVSLWPMSDLPVTVWWLAATWLVLAGGGSTRRAAAAGVAAGLAILTRPNLAPLLIPLGLGVAAGSHDGGARCRIGPMLAFGLGAGAGAIAIALLHDRLYGSPFMSGYGSVDSLYSVGHLAANLHRFPRWMLEADTPFIFLGLAAPFVRPGAHPERIGRARDIRLLLGLAATVVVSYLFYRPFDEWWFLRFLVPAYPALLALAVAVTFTLTARARHGTLVAGLVCLLVATVLAGRSGAYRPDVQGAERKFIAVGEYIDARLPANALCISVHHSGSLRYYADRLTLRYDYIPAADLTRVVAWVRARGYTPYVVLESWEEPAFRRRFSDAAAIGRIDWRPIAVFDHPGSTSVRIYDPRDRAPDRRARVVTTRIP